MSTEKERRKEKKRKKKKSVIESESKRNGRIETIRGPLYSINRTRNTYVIANLVQDRFARVERLDGLEVELYALLDPLPLDHGVEEILERQIALVRRWMGHYRLLNVLSCYFAKHDVCLQHHRVSFEEIRGEFVREREKDGKRGESLKERRGVRASAPSSEECDLAARGGEEGSEALRKKRRKIGNRGHVQRISITPKQVTERRDSNSSPFFRYVFERRV